MAAAPMCSQAVAQQQSTLDRHKTELLTPNCRVKMAVDDAMFVLFMQFVENDSVLQHDATTPKHAFEVDDVRFGTGVLKRL